MTDLNPLDEFITAFICSTTSCYKKMQELSHHSPAKGKAHTNRVILNYRKTKGSTKKGENVFQS